MCAQELCKQLDGPLDVLPREGSAVREEPEKSSSLCESSYRIAILAVVTGCHLGLLMLLLRPVVFYRSTVPVARNNPLALKLRFFRLPSSSSHPALPAHRVFAPAARSHAMLVARSPKPQVVQQAAHVGARSYETHSVDAWNPDTGEENSISDGGFRDRLRKAQHSYSIHGVPGSDTSFVPGIRLVDPMRQGIGAVIRATQRAFGVKDSHCIDIDVWRHLAPRELSARHVSPGDVDKVDEQYGCNKPPGLHF